MKLEVTDLAKTILSHLADIQSNRGSHISSFWQICNSLDSDLSLNDFESMVLRNSVLVPFKDEKIGYEKAMLLACTKIGSIKKTIEADFAQHCEDFGCECGCSGQLKLATVLELSQYKRSDSLGVNPPLY